MARKDHICKSYIDKSNGPKFVDRSMWKSTRGYRARGQWTIIIIFTKFAAVVPYTFMIMCTNFGKKLTDLICRSYIKNQMDPSSRTRAWLPSVLNLRRL